MLLESALMVQIETKLKNTLNWIALKSHLDLVTLTLCVSEILLEKAVNVKIQTFSRCRYSNLDLRIPLCLYTCLCIFVCKFSQTATKNISHCFFTYNTSTIIYPLLICRCLILGTGVTDSPQAMRLIKGKVFSVSEVQEWCCVNKREERPSVTHFGLCKQPWIVSSVRSRAYVEGRFMCHSWLHWKLDRRLCPTEMHMCVQFYAVHIDASFPQTMTCIFI